MPGYRRFCELSQNKLSSDISASPKKLQKIVLARLNKKKTEEAQ